MSIRIEKCLSALKQRLYQNNGIIQIQLEEGALLNVTCQFNAGMDEHKIEQFFRSNDWEIPDDYASFLKLHNGATLFCDPLNGGGLKLFDIDSILLYRNDYDYMFPPDCYPVGMLNGAMIYICSKDVLETPDQYLYWQDCIASHDTALKLNINFEVFLDLFIISQGSEYWLWPTFKYPY